ncbi:hypothetical protein BHU72_03945 [Desulfuribacillus stibiiarsenatis]|uniref:UDP-N-acetylmuramoyl-tripeptide--D-alanyl-D-alanine ligase n=1 Tax=Desulfuribacillus stibiiarsenatis TaxID=1390249 RepID=A0A1E5L725_9FIRM|nr:UDP-N-acetylmuramoyl-tripeptide--D-alanyl-D-alanine ligase [Desulfuribacillus stibiiarsenatis]OEH85931.1 hypothetical protein BHU72_03945 [Desulfuribacillus stibiiarsenatis]
MNIGKFVSIVNGVTKSPSSIPISRIIYEYTRFVSKGDFFWVRDREGNIGKIKKAIQRGAVGIISPLSLRGRLQEHSHIHYVYVNKSMIKKYCNYHRNQFNLPVIGITGSAGKTTTKNMVSQILKSQGKVIHTVASVNAVGTAPMYALKINSSHRYGVFEMGMKGLGQIRVMGSYLKPTIGIITNIGDAHIGKLGNSIENIIRAKSEIVGEISSNGYLILNADNPYTDRINVSKFKGKKIIYVGIHNKADIKAYDIQYLNRATSFKIEYENNTYSFHVPTIGEHNLYNALAAIATGFILNVPYSRMKQRLSTFKNAGMRTQVLRGLNGTTLISDAYNANPTAAIEGLNTMKKISKGKPMLAVIGDMSEQGTHTIQGHKKVGKHAADLGIDVVGIGVHGKSVVDGANSSNNTVNSTYLKNKKAAYQYLRNRFSKDMYVYFKASRDFRMETLIRKLTAKRNEQ